MCKLFSARRTFHPLEINSLRLGGCNDLSAFRADGIEGRQHVFEIDLPRTWHRAKSATELAVGL